MLSTAFRTFPQNLFFHYHNIFNYIAYKDISIKVDNINETTIKSSIGTSRSNQAYIFIESETEPYIEPKVYNLNNDNTIIGIYNYNTINTYKHILYMLKEKNNIDISKVNSITNKPKIVEYVYKSEYDIIENSNQYRYLLTIGITCCDKDYSKCLESVKNIHSQASENVEILVVDNCVENKVEFPEYVNHIVTGDNMFPFASRIFIAENAKGKYIWFVDGDDKINVSEAESFISDKNQDMIIFNVDNIENKTVYTTDIIGYVDSPNYRKIDNTLHNAIIHSRLTKFIVNFPKEKIYYFEDTFYLFYFLSKSTNIVFTNIPIYDYIIEQGNMFHINTAENLQFFLTGYPILKKLIKSNFNEYIGTIVLNHSTAGIVWCIPKMDRIKFQNVLDSNVDYYSVHVKNSNDYNNQKAIITDLYVDSVDIIYIFYGKNLDDEIKNIQKNIECNYNLIIIDYFNTIKNRKSYNIVSFNDNLSKSFLEASKYMKFNNVWVLESYKGIYYFNSNLLRSKTTLYYPSCDGVPYFFDLIRNNVIFDKVDFINFCNSNEINLSMLDILIYNYVIHSEYFMVYSPLAYVEPFDETDITFFFMSFNNLLEKDYQAQFCFNKFKELFPKSNIKVFTENDVIPYLKNNKITKGLLKYRKTSLNLINYENDILRLLIAQDINKSMYVDLDVVIRNKNKFLKTISLYPNMCPTYEGYFEDKEPYVLHNESMWTLGHSKFVEENINFYKDLTINDLLKNKDKYWNGGVSLNIIKNNGLTVVNSTCKVLDITGIRYLTDTIYHWCGSRFTIKPKTKNIGIFSNPMFNDTKNAFTYIDFNFCINNNIDMLYIISDGSIHRGKYHHTSHPKVSDITTIERYIDDANTINMIKKEIASKYNDISFFSVPSILKQDLNIFTIILNDNIPKYNQECINSWKRGINIVNTINVLRLEDCFDLYLKDFSKKEIDIMLKDSPRKLESIIKENIIGLNSNRNILILDNDVYIQDIGNFINNLTISKSKMSSDSIINSSIIYKKIDIKSIIKNEKFEYSYDHSSVKKQIYNNISKFNIDSVYIKNNSSIVTINNNFKINYPYTYKFNLELCNDVYDELKFYASKELDISRSC